jgi:putative ABC transport system permease protein
MLGIFIGIAALVSLISLGSGLQAAITGQFATLDADKLVVQNADTGFGPPGSLAVRKLTQHDLELIRNVAGVEFAIPRYIRSVKVDYNRITNFYGATNIPKDEEETKIVYDVLNVKIQEGKLLESKDSGKVILGNGFLDENNFEKKIKIVDKVKIQEKDFEVKGILKRSGNFFVNNIIIIPQEELKEILKIDDEIDLIAVQVIDESFTEKAASDIVRKLRKDRKLKLGEEDFSVQTPLQSISGVNTFLNILNLIISGIAAISLLIGGIGIANTMYTSVLERTKDIGLMKAVGAENKDILQVFLIEAGLLGLVGGIIGALIGLGLALAVSSMASALLGGINLQVEVSYSLLISAVSFSLLVGILSGILPALQASRLKPVEALRK